MSTLEAPLDFALGGDVDMTTSAGGLRPILNLKSYAIVRTTSPNPVNGRKVAGVETAFPILANVQPVTAKQLMSLPNERRSEVLKRFFTSTRIYRTGELVNGVQYDADQIVINNERYEVFQVDDWNVAHFECIATRMVTP
jgi:hypothetical protein